MLIEMKRTARRVEIYVHALNPSKGQQRVDLKVHPTRTSTQGCVDRGGVLAMLGRYIGEKDFQAGIRPHMERHADGTASAEDFIVSLAEAPGKERLCPHSCR